ncbi:VanZ family protein [Lentisphaera marina]|uniref:VanZ family protein n=1 Tax=Lentisphaera marina TaxID=1111041 RepID=UPI003B67DFB5
MNSKNKIKYSIKGSTILIFLLITYFSFLPGTSLPISYGKLIEKYPNIDLFIHAFVFFFVYLITYLSFNVPKEKIFVLTIFLSTLLEISQPVFSPKRLFTISDLLSNYLGILLAYLIIFFKSKNYEISKT